MENELGIVYLIDTAQQFWSELDDILHIPSDDSTTLLRLDSALKSFLSIGAAYHEQYLQSPFQLEHACDLLLDSELFKFHSERMCEILSDEAQSNTDPHFQLIVYNVLLYYGRRHPSFLRSQKRWQPLLPLLMDHILVDIDPEVQETYLGLGSFSDGTGRSSISLPAVPIPIEAKLRSLAVRLVYEVCRVQKLTVQELKIFDNAFLDHLFELVEQTRNMQDESFNYSVIKLIVSLNEQFMVASLSPGTNTPVSDQTVPPRPAEGKNRVLNVLMRRLGSSKTFGENMIFMLNRANRTPEDLCMQLLVLKILYILFTTKGTSEYFYTNDLRVLVDVFLRELVDLDEDSESLRHTYLRVLHPLLTKTQLRDVPYKRPQIVYALESLTDNAEIRDVNPTTRRLVERCLSGEWCVQFRKVKAIQDANAREGSPSNESVAAAARSYLAPPPVPPPPAEKSPAVKQKTLKPSRSVGNLQETQQKPPGRLLDTPRRPSNDSAISLSGVASATAFPTSQKKRSDRPSVELDTDHTAPNGNHKQESQHEYPRAEDDYVHPLSARADSLGTAIDHIMPPSRPHPPPHPPASSSLPSSPSHSQKTSSHRRSAPAPPKRRKPPAVPVGRTTSGATITTIASSTMGQSARSPLSRV